MMDVKDLERALRLADHHRQAGETLGLLLTLEGKEVVVTFGIEGHGTLGSMTVEPRVAEGMARHGFNCSTSVLRALGVNVPGEPQQEAGE
jgi:hypothetical protein